MLKSSSVNASQYLHMQPTHAFISENDDFTDEGICRLLFSLDVSATYG